MIDGRTPNGVAATGSSTRKIINCGHLAMRIARDGTWFYHGTPIGRKEMVRLFASVLVRREDGRYWLATPAEEGLIDVDDAPFVAVAMEATGSGRDQVLRMTTNIDDEVPLDSEHPLRVASGESGPVPYMKVRGGLEARIARPVYYEMAERAVAEDRDGAPVLGVWSAGSFFPLEPAP